MKKLLKSTACILFSAAVLISCNEDDAVSLSDLTPEIINNNSPLSSFIEDIATGSTSAGDCISINYPVTIDAYSADMEFIQSYVLTSDADLAVFAEGLDQEGNYAIQYPISITGYNAQVIEVNGNAALLAAVQAELAECEANSCETENTVFQQAYTALSTMPNVTEIFTMDAWTHEYTFSMSQSGIICSIGYMAESQATPIVYEIQILDANDNVIYTGNHSFSTTMMEYISIPPVFINANEQYTIKRSIESYNVGMGIGTILDRSQNMGQQAPLLPYTQGNITIHYSRYYGGGGSLDPDFYTLPMIDFAFKPM